MKKKTLWITETAMILALLVTLQFATKSLGQLVTGSCVNLVLAVSVLVGGMGCGMTVAAISPLMAFLLGIAPNVVTVPAIMAGNVVYVVLLRLIATGSSRVLWRQAAAWLAASAAKFAVLYLLVVQVICGIAAPALTGMQFQGKPVLAEKMLKVLPAQFTWPQLFTALIGGAIALLAVPVIRNAMKR